MPWTGCVKEAFTLCNAVRHSHPLHTWISQLWAVREEPEFQVSFSFLNFSVTIHMNKHYDCLHRTDCLKMCSVIYIFKRYRVFHLTEVFQSVWLFRSGINTVVQPCDTDHFSSRKAWPWCSHTGIGLMSQSWPDFLRMGPGDRISCWATTDPLLLLLCASWMYLNIHWRAECTPKRMCVWFCTLGTTLGVCIRTLAHTCS